MRSDFLYSHRKAVLILAIIFVATMLSIIYIRSQPLCALSKNLDSLSSCSIIRSDAEGTYTTVIKDPHALQDIAAYSKSVFPLWVGFASDHDLEDGVLYYIAISGYNNGVFSELCDVTVDSKGFLQTSYFKYRLFGCNDWMNIIKYYCEQPAM